MTTTSTILLLLRALLLYDDFLTSSHDARLDHVDGRHDHSCGHAGKRAEQEVLLPLGRAAGEVRVGLLGLREKHEGESVPGDVARDGGEVALVKAGDALGGHELDGARQRVGVDVRLHALLDHLLRHAHDRRGERADGAAAQLGERTLHARRGELLLGELKRSELAGARGECEQELRGHALNERLGVERHRQALGLEARAHHVDRVQHGLRDAARAGARDQALAEEHLRLPLIRALLLLDDRLAERRGEGAQGEEAAHIGAAVLNCERRKKSRRYFFNEIC